MKPLKIVFDTNVYLAAIFAPQGYASIYIREAGLKRRFVLFTSLEILAEIKAKIVSKVPDHGAKLANELITYITSIAELVQTTSTLSVVSDDPDNRILECAVDSGANFIVTFDKDLLSLKSYENVAIIHPSLLQDYFPR